MKRLSRIILLSAMLFLLGLTMTETGSGTLQFAAAQDARELAISSPLAQGNSSPGAKEKVLFSGYDFHPTNDLYNDFEVSSYEYVSPILELIPGSDKGLGNFRFNAIAAGDLNGDTMDEQIIAWVDPANNHIYVNIVEIPGTSGLVFDTGATTSSLPVVRTIENTVFDISAGYFTSEDHQQIVLAYVDAGGKLRLEIHELQGGSSLVKIGEISASVALIPGQMPRVTAGDVDGNGVDEIGLAHMTDSMNVNLKVYHVLAVMSEPTPYVLEMIKDNLINFLWGNYYYFAGTLRISAGDVVEDNTPNDEFVLISDWYAAGDKLGVLLQVYDFDDNGWVWTNHKAGVMDADEQNWGELYATGFDVAVGNVDGRAWTRLSSPGLLHFMIMIIRTSTGEYSWFV